MGEVRGYVTWAGARSPRALQTLKAKVFSLSAGRQTRHKPCSLGLYSSVSRVLPAHRLHSASASYQRSQTSRNLLAKPECDSCESFQQMFHRHHREQQSLERPCVPGPCCSAKDCSSVPAAVLPRWQRPTHGTAPDRPHTRATQETTRLGRPGCGSEISTWTSDLGQHMAVLEIRSIRLF